MLLEAAAAAAAAVQQVKKPLGRIRNILKSLRNISSELATNILFASRYQNESFHDELRARMSLGHA
jgi:hypothetical protein